MILSELEVTRNSFSVRVLRLSLSTREVQCTFKGRAANWDTYSQCSISPYNKCFAPGLEFYCRRSFKYEDESNNIKCRQSGDKVRFRGSHGTKEAANLRDIYFQRERRIRFYLGIGSQPLRSIRQERKSECVKYTYNYVIPSLAILCCCFHS